MGEKEGKAVVRELMKVVHLAVWWWWFAPDQGSTSSPAPGCRNEKSVDSFFFLRTCVAAGLMSSLLLTLPQCPDIQRSREHCRFNIDFRNINLLSVTESTYLCSSKLNLLDTRREGGGGTLGRGRENLTLLRSVDYQGENIASATPTCDHLPGEDRGRWAHCTLGLACTEVPRAPTYWYHNC